MGWGTWEVGMQKEKPKKKEKVQDIKPIFDKSQNIFDRKKSKIFN